MQIDLNGKRAIVCGSTQGIGRAIAEQMADSGAEVILLARNEAKLKEVCASLQHPERHRYQVADFSDPLNLKKALQQINGAVHILVNNTGGPPAGKAIDADITQYEQAFRQHLICNQILVQHVVHGMREEGYGRIINIISTSVKQPLPNLGVSNTIRGAVGNWSKTLANELGPDGITVNNVLPGATETERLEQIISRKVQQGAVEEQVRKGMLNAIPAGRFAKAEEIAYAAVFLASEQAAYINGTNIVVDGGRTGNL
ncbi:MAG: SDR family oxidoreductase [Flavobacteriales bacterium]|nr:SDR family oxidoreductase [Flavobacteriales bacterium]